ncbi:hypothetical protein ElyMa_000786400 [Elysia marginata]|uniref:Secreted protein n=1 Tax=Elysia marginata TaxID=1093978 RepID=A0AAV4GV35_9GAST|nr:hypothetical protein ElyMa_000786400 [Elysia marginata]
MHCKRDTCCILIFRIVVVVVVVAAAAAAAEVVVVVVVITFIFRVNLLFYEPVWKTQKSKMIACRLSGKHYKRAQFVENRLVLSFLHGGGEQNNNVLATSKSGCFFFLNGGVSRDTIYVDGPNRCYSYQASIRSATNHTLQEQHQRASLIRAKYP